MILYLQIQILLEKTMNNHTPSFAEMFKKPAATPSCDLNSANWKWWNNQQMQT